MALLTQDGFNIGVLSSECGELFLSHFCLFSARRDMIAFAQFLSQQVQFPLRTPSEFGVWAVTLSPFPVNVGVADAHIKGFLLVVAESPVSNSIPAHTCLCFEQTHHFSALRNGAGTLRGPAALTRPGGCLRA